MKNKILIVASYTQSLINFRKKLLLEFQKHDFEVIACAPQYDSSIIHELNKHGIKFIKYTMNTTGLNPFQDLFSFFNLYHIINKVRPDYVFSYTVKPVIYTSLAAKFKHVNHIFSIITGLGYSFERDNKKQIIIGSIVKFLYKISLKQNTCVFFQNPDDKSLFINFNIINNKDRCTLINGSGVDIQHFTYVNFYPKIQRFLLIARLIKDKGIFEYVEAAIQLKKRYSNIEFDLLGFFYSNPNEIKKEIIGNWIKNGFINFHNKTDDVRPYLKNCSVYVLPSYREGTPRTVLEAMAIGRPIITTDVPGCRETVVNGENGFLVKPRDVDSLVEAMEKFIKKPALIPKMGKRSREIAEEKYDVHKVNSVIIEAMGLKKPN